jgi:hypothetical protein
MQGWHVVAGVLLNLVLSALVGLIPLILGQMRRRSTLGIVGLVVCVVGGFFLSFFAAIVLAILFAIAIWASSRGATRAAAA